MTSAIVAFVLLLGLGWTLRHHVLTEPGFWCGLELLSYRVFTPALFLTTIGGTNLESVPLAGLVLALTTPVIVVSALLLALKRPMRADGPRVSSLVQGSIRINTYIGLVFADALHGADGVATFALASAVMVPLLNVISVSVLAVHGDNAVRVSVLGVARDLVSNPLIQSCVMGLTLSLLGLSLPGFLSITLTMLASPALVSGTLAVGAAFTLTLRRRDVLDIAFTAGIKLLALPFAAGAIAHALGVRGALLTSIVLICAVPTAPSAYVLASRMGGDARLMASITGAQTLLAIITLPLLVG